MKKLLSLLACLVIMFASCGEINNDGNNETDNGNGAIIIGGEDGNDENYNDDGFQKYTGDEMQEPNMPYLDYYIDFTKSYALTTKGERVPLMELEDGFVANGFYYTGFSAKKGGYSPIVYVDDYKTIVVQMQSYSPISTVSYPKEGDVEINNLGGGSLNNVNENLNQSNLKVSADGLTVTLDMDSILHNNSNDTSLKNFGSSLCEFWLRVVHHPSGYDPVYTSLEI